jgi:hypothetical protein
VDNLLPLITGGGGALVVLALWVWALATGKLHSDPEFSKVVADNDGLRAANDKLTEALALERQRSDAATQAGAVTNQLIGALTTLATEHRAAEKHEHAGASDKADAHAHATGTPGLPGKDPVL